MPTNIKHFYNILTELTWCRGPRQAGQQQPADSEPHHSAVSSQQTYSSQQQTASSQQIYSSVQKTRSITPSLSSKKAAEMKAMLQVLVDKGEERHGLLRRLID